MKISNGVRILVLLFMWVCGNSEYLDVDMNGEIIRSKLDSGIKATFLNTYNNQSLDLYWVNNSGEDVTIATIYPDDQTEINTYVGHSFYAKNNEEPFQRVHPQLIHIKRNVFSYSFGPSSSSSVRVGLHPSVKFLNAHSGAVSAKFRSLAPSIEMWYEDGNGGTFQGTLKLGMESTTNTYEGHVFYFTETGHPDNELARYTMTQEQVIYPVINPAFPPPQHLLDLTSREEAFSSDYFNRTGIRWRHFYGVDGPRGPPKLHMWPAEQVGQVHEIVSSEGHWRCKGPWQQCQDRAPLTLEMEVISLAPRAFVIPHFLSDYEADEIIRQAAPQMGVSLVGNDDGGGSRTSDTRTSRNTWLPRPTSDVTRTLFMRAAHLLNIDEKLLNSYANCEDMQVVHYAEGQKYDSHHDWGVSGYAESRYITLLLYLNNQAGPNAGGETSFPKAAGGRGIKVHPGKGSAVLFYNLLEDGNGDDLSLHAATPVLHGEKWLANFWVWDPKRK